MRRLIDGLAIASFAGFLLIAGGGAYGYFWLKGNQDALVDQVVKKVAGNLPIPKIGGSTGPALPMKGKLPF